MKKNQPINIYEGKNLITAKKIEKPVKCLNDYDELFFFVKNLEESICFVIKVYSGCRVIISY